MNDEVSKENAPRSESAKAGEIPAFLKRKLAEAEQKVSEVKANVTANVTSEK